MATMTERRAAQAKDARTALRLFGPVFEGAAERSYGVRHCVICTPPPKMHKCPMCDWETPDRWRLLLHLSTRPDWCERQGRKKAAKWAERV